MKKTFLAVITFLLSVFSSMNSHAMDLEKDQLIIEALTSNEFTNVLINYEFKGKEYPIRIIFNPNKQTLWGETLEDPTVLSLIIVANVPIPLERYIEDLVLELRGSDEDCYLALKHEEPSEWDAIKPVYIAQSAKDSINDEILCTTFSSDEFVHQVIYYQVGQEFYQVRLLHNPQKKTFSATRRYDLISYQKVDIILTWNKKYAILIDKEAPKELENHLSDSLKHLSYWDWFFNYTFSNGTCVKHQKMNIDRSTSTWDLDTWFIYTENFHL